MTTRGSLTREGMLAGMQQALDEEIAEKIARPNIKHSAVGGKLVSEGNGQYLYQYTLLDPWTPDDDTPLSIVNPEAKGLKCSVVTSTGTLLTIASDQVLSPSLLHQIDLSDDSTELLKRQKEALKQAEEGKSQLASKCFGLIAYRYIAAASDKRFGTLRDNQYVAAQRALGGEVAFIVGPPGTGKTLTLAAIAFQHLQARRTVLIAAHTNIAIDNAIMKLCELCKSAGRPDLLRDGQVVRYGAVQKAELKTNPEYAEVYLPKIAQSLDVTVLEHQKAVKAELEQVGQKLASILQQQQGSSKPLEQQLSEITDQIAYWNQDLAPLEQEEQRYIALLQAQQKQYTANRDHLQQEATQAGQQLARAKAQEEERKRELEHWRQREQQTVTRLVEARAMSGIKRLFKGLRPKTLEEQVTQYSHKAYVTQQALDALQPEVRRVQEAFSQYTQELEKSEYQLKTILEKLHAPGVLAQRIAKLREQKARAEQQATGLRAALKQEKARSDAEAQALQAQKDSLETALAELDQQLRDIEKSIVEKALVVGTTLTKTYMNKAVTNRRFDAVILDEVSMAPMPLVYLAATHAERSVTLIGDPKQLAPIVSSKKPMAQQWLGKDLFDLRGISLKTADQRSQHSVLLNVQSRMHPDISRIANKLVYSGRLLDEFDLSELKQISPLPTSPLVLCDTQDACPLATRPTRGRSWKNYYHALCCITLARKMLEEHPDLKEKSEPAIGIVTPYREQAQLLQSLLKDARLQIHVQAGTIHRFQGLEFEFIIFDTVASIGSHASDFIAGGRDSDSMRLLNVAVTRAKQKLVIVANLRFIQDQFQESSIMHQVVLMAARTATIPSLNVVGTSFSSLVAKARRAHPEATTPEAILALLDMKREELLVLLGAPGIQHFTEETFYAALERDVQDATKSIQIASAFLTKFRVGKLLDLLLEQQQKGISITVFTRPLDESEDWDVKAANTLKNAGIVLSYRSAMHEKMVIIDEKILYHGSLNTLSYRDTTESILRIVNSAVVQDAQKVLQSSSKPKQSFSKRLTEAERDALEIVNVSVKHLPSTTTTCGCGKLLVAKLRNDGTGPFYGCPNFQSCSYRSIENLLPSHIQQVEPIQNCLCSKCDDLLIPQIDGKIVLLVCNTPGCGEMQRVVFIR